MYASSSTIYRETKNHMLHASFAVKKGRLSILSWKVNRKLQWKEIINVVKFSHFQTIEVWMKFYYRHRCLQQKYKGNDLYSEFLSTLVYNVLTSWIQHLKRLVWNQQGLRFEVIQCLEETIWEENVNIMHWKLTNWLAYSCIINVLYQPISYSTVPGIKDRHFLEWT